MRIKDGDRIQEETANGTQGRKTQELLTMKMEPEFEKG